MPGVRLLRRHDVAADDCIEQPVEPEHREQPVGRRLRLVGAHAKAKPPCAQPLQDVDHVAMHGGPLGRPRRGSAQPGFTPCDIARGNAADGAAFVWLAASKRVYRVPVDWALRALPW